MVSLLLSALKNEDELYLIPANENYKPIKITEEMNFLSLGSSDIYYT